MYYKKVVLVTLSKVIYYTIEYVVDYLLEDDFGTAITTVLCCIVNQLDNAIPFMLNRITRTKAPLDSTSTFSFLKVLALFVLELTRSSINITALSDTRMANTFPIYSLSEIKEYGFF